MPVIKVKSEEVKIKVPITTLRIEPTTQTKTVEPTIEEQVITPDEGVFALSSVTVNPVTKEIDENIKAENIKEGVSILGVKGNVVVPDTNLEITNADYLFYNEARMDIFEEILALCKNVTSTQFMFYNSDFTEINLTGFDTSKVKNMTSMFHYCRNLINIIGLESFDTSQVENMTSVFEYSNLTTLNLKSWNTINVKTMYNMFSYCFDLVELSEIDASGCTEVRGMFKSCRGLSNFGGLKDFGKAFKTTVGENSSSLKLDLSPSTQLTEQSLINVLNNLYDIASIGVKTQTCQLGSTNLAKLTSEAGQQALARATEKGWNIS